jgi:hypothetical protein
MSEDLIIAFELVRNSEEFFELSGNIYINSVKCKVGNNIIYDPYLAFAPKNCINFIEDNNNNIRVHCVGIYNTPDSNSGNLHQICIKKEVLKNYYTSYLVKNNFITPYYTNFKYLTKMHNFYSSYSAYFPLKSMFDLQTDINNEQILVTKFSGLDKIEQLTQDRFIVIRKILRKTNEKLNIIIKNVLQTDVMTEDDLIEWINKKKPGLFTRFYNEDEIKSGNYNCFIDCSKLSGFKADVEALIVILKKLRITIGGLLNHNHTNYLNFLVDNYRLLSNLLICNSYISALYRLDNAFKNCIPLSCHEVYEINQIFNRTTENISTLEGIVEIIFGNLLKDEQWMKIKEIFDNFNRKDKYQIHQFMMGKGKSSIITPMLVCLINYTSRSNLYIVVPDQLKKQTEQTMIEYQYYFSAMYLVVTDSEVKNTFLTSEVKENNNIYLIDEFDYMYNPLQSNFNIIEESENIDIELIDRVFNFVNLFLNNRISNDYPKYSLESDIISILTNKSYVKYKNYGMSIKFNYRYCIPYLRKDSPNEGSQFSSNIITIVLTILYFYDKERGFILEEKDIILLFTKSKLILKRLLLSFDITNYSSLSDILYQFKIKKSNKIPANIFLEYLYVVFSELNESTIIKNCSFIDIINMNSKWQVGYSGTVNVNLEIEPIIPWNKYNMKVIEDPDEKNNVISSLNYNQEVYSINDN